MASDLTPKQERFCEEYLVDLNATQAAIRAGYEFSPVPFDGFYTYLLIDPRSEKIFYVGKGKNKRIATHAQRAKKGKIDNPIKFSKIKDIHRAGMDVIERVFSTHLDEEEAFTVERLLILQLAEHGLTNISGGTISAEEATKKAALNSLMAMKPYQEWIMTADMDILEMTARVFGHPSIVYRKIIEGYLSIIEGAYPPMIKGVEFAKK